MPEAAPVTLGLRIVLFGMAGAGKSSLLGALAQAAQTQQAVLGSTLTDTSGGLAELQKRTYDGKQTQTQEEIVPYAVTLQGDEPLQATFIDSDGRVAQELLAGNKSVADAGGLPRAIVDADAVVLVIAPSSEPGQLDQTFQQFSDFLKLFEQHRGRRSDIAGLPVYLVLSKCDLLAKKDDTHSAWMERIEERKRKIAKRFEDFLEENRVMPFGKIDLHLWATAVKRPALSDRPAKPQEPYGVAELFRQVLDSARVFHDHRAQAHRRLHVAVLGLVAVVAVMGVLAAWFFMTRPSADLAALENSIQAVLPGQGTSATERLREPLEPKIKELVKIQAHPEFANLEPKQQELVRQTLREMEAYLDLVKKTDTLKRVRFFKKEEEIDEGNRELAKMSLPAEYTAQWNDTRLARKLAAHRAELAALAKALADEKEWLKKQIDEGEKLPRITIAGEGSPERQAWITRADAFLKRKDLTKDVPGVPNMKLRDLYEFPTVAALREEYERIRPRVERIRGGLQ